MSEQPRQRIPALLLSLVPGWGHVYWGRESAGIGIFSAAALVGFAFLNSSLVYQGAGKTTLAWVFGVILGLVMAANWIDIFLRTDPERIAEDDRRRRLCMQRGTAAYLQGDLDGALGEFRECLKIEPNCPESLFRLGVLAVQKDDLETARSSFRRALRYDLAEKWSWEIEQQFKHMDAHIAAHDEGSSREEPGGEVAAGSGQEETPERGKEEAERAST
mgnify:CR=1 FL=1